MPALDLSGVPVVDNHCHGIYRAQAIADVATWRGYFTESRDPETRAQHAAHTLYYHRLIREMAGFLGCEPSEVAVIATREQRSGDEMIASLLRAANIQALLIDKGYPDPDSVLPDDRVSALGGCRVGPILRLETLMQELIATHEALETVEQALRDALADIRAQGYVALKSIVAYRTGLHIETWLEDAVEQAFMQARRDVAEQGVVRLAEPHKPLLDTLLHVAFEEVARQEVPVQFHVGYGDTDANLLYGNPLLLREVLENPAYRALPIVLLHECYPYTREGAYLAAVYDNVYLDLSYGIPLIGYQEMLAYTRAALGVAPYSKLLYSSDGVGIPEIHWASALHGRRVLGQALGECVDAGELTPSQAEAAGSAILRENATRLYRL